MKRKDKETLSALSVPELASELSKRKEELFKIKFSRAMSVPKNPLRERELRREVARIMTWMAQKNKELSGVSA